MKRIEAIASLVTKDAYLLDIGTDHAYLPIYLYKNNITHNLIASDISKNVLENTKKNIAKSGLNGKIKLALSDGFKNITDDVDEAVIAGMGTGTIKKILDTKKLPNSLIICSHNNLYELRLFMQNIGYRIEKEIICYDKKIYYDIIKYKKGREILREDELLLGKISDYDYLSYLKDKYINILNKSSDPKYKKFLDIIEKKLN